MQACRSIEHGAAAAIIARERMPRKHLCKRGRLTTLLAALATVALVGVAPALAAPRAKHDLRRLRRIGLITRIPAARYQLTREGRMIAVFFTKTHTPIVNPALAELDPHLPDPIAKRTPLGRPWRDFEHALNDRIKQAAIAA